MRTIDAIFGRLGRRSPWLCTLAAAALLLAGVPNVHAEGRQADSDDYVCNHGAPDDPTVIEACGRLRGTTAGAGAQDIGRQHNSDDYNCNHGDPNDPATLAACHRLRGTTYGVGRDEGHQRNSDDWNCHHGVPGDPATLAACERLHGSFEVATRQNGFVVAHFIREYGTPRYIGGHAYRSARYTVQFNCAAGERRRIGYALYSGHGATGHRVGGSSANGAWRAAASEDMPAACR